MMETHPPPARSSHVMIEVSSTAIAAIDYRATRRELIVTFRDSGETYVYAGVPPAVFGAFVRAPSKGEFFNAEVKDRYAFSRLRRPRRRRA